MTDPGRQVPLAGGVDLSGLVERAKRQGQPAPVASPSPFVRDISEAEMASIVELSNTVPVILEVYGQGVTASLPALIDRYEGKLVLATVDADRAPQLVSALQITALPTVFAIIQGRPAPLYQGMAPEDQLASVFDEVLAVAANAGVSGVMPRPGEPSADDDAGQPAASAHLVAAEAAINSNDFDAAEDAYAKALADNPRDGDALTGRARLGLLRRVQEYGATDVRGEAAANPTLLPAQLQVADLDMASGHVDDAFARLLGLFGQLDQDGKDAVRVRLLEYFDVCGPSHPSVPAARRTLTSMLY